MLYLVLTICSSALVSIFMRVSERYVRSNMVMFSANYAVCTAVSLLYGRRARKPRRRWERPLPSPWGR